MILEEEVVVQRPGYLLTISAPQPGTVRLTARREISRSAEQIVNSLAEIDIARDEFAAVVEAIGRWLDAAPYGERLVGGGI